jgi:hypothetical protein
MEKERVAKMNTISQFLQLIVGKAKIILIAIILLAIIVLLAYCKGGADREAKLRANTTTVTTTIVIHDTLRPKPVTVALITKPENNPLTIDVKKVIDSLITERTRVKGLRAQNDSLRNLLYEKLPPFSAWVIDTTTAISQSGEDTVSILFRIDATANPVERQIRPLTLALAPIDLPKKKTVMENTVFVSDPWYVKAEWFAGGGVLAYLIYSAVHH